MYRHHFSRIYSVFGNDDIPSQVADSDYFISSFHSAFLDFIDACIYVLVTASVERCSMHMNDKRLSGKSFSRDSGHVCKPVMGMNHIEFPFSGHGDGSAYHGITGHFLHKVGAVFP